MEITAQRHDPRVPMRISVDLASLDVRAPARNGVTENISLRGARVVTSVPWQPNAKLNIRSLLGNFRSRARVVYCEPLKSGSYALGLQLVATAGDWKFKHSTGGTLDKAAND